VIDGPETDGELLYIKPVIGGEEPTDIAHYASAHPDFPHAGRRDLRGVLRESQTTLDQIRTRRLLMMPKVDRAVRSGCKTALVALDCTRP
jgi:hypothetical protein